MGKSVLVVSKSETFIIKGLEMKIKGLGVNVVFSELNAGSLEGKIGSSEMVVLYTDSDIGTEAKTLSYIKEECIKDNKRIIVIGTMQEYETVLNSIPGGFIIDFFERPLEMEKLLDAVEKHLAEDDSESIRKSILIVDDDVQYMSMINDWLKDTYRISMANSGVNAITWLATNHADLILLDYEMPVTTGPMVLEMLKSEGNTKDIPVMFLTGNNSKESIVKVLSLGPVDYLLKTIDKNGLHEKIDKYFANQGTYEKNR